MGATHTLSVRLKEGKIIESYIDINKEKGVRDSILKMDVHSWEQPLLATGDLSLNQMLDPSLFFLE